MGASVGRSGKKQIGGINMTPFVDIVLVLLVIFMMAAKLVGDPKALKVELPSATSGEAAKRETVLSLVIDATGTMRVDGETIVDDSFAAVVDKAKRADRVRIAADGNAPHKSVVHAMDLFGKAGVTHLSFAVTDKK
jgi:biopolymer transport protein ExbD